MWRVLLKGARRGDAWKDVYRGPEASAKTCYDEELARLDDDGHVVLTNPLGVIVRHWWDGRGKPASAQLARA